MISIVSSKILNIFQISPTVRIIYHMTDYHVTFDVRFAVMFIIILVKVKNGLGSFYSDTL